jgi:hypothetical protein
VQVCAGFPDKVTLTFDQVPAGLPKGVSAQPVWQWLLAARMSEAAQSAPRFSLERPRTETPRRPRAISAAGSGC